MKVLVIGSLNMDMTFKVNKLPKLGETIFANDYYESCGGKGANQAVAMSKLGLDITILGKIGNDEVGKRILDNLFKNGVKSSVILSEYPTGKAIINVDEEGNNNIVVLAGANFKLSIDDIDNNLEVIDSSDVIVMQNEIPLEVIKHVLKISKKRNKITVFNPAPAIKLDSEIYENVNYLVVNETELKTIFDISIEDNNFEKDIIDIKLKENIDKIVLTMGEKGSILFSDDDYIHYPAYKVKAIDTTAAGDSFIGALVSKIDNLDAAMKYASAVSAIVVTRVGAQDSIPSFDEIEEFIKNNNNII